MTNHEVDKFNIVVHYILDNRTIFKRFNNYKTAYEFATNLHEDASFISLKLNAGFKQKGDNNER